MLLLNESYIFVIIIPNTKTIVDIIKKTVRNIIGKPIVLSTLILIIDVVIDVNINDKATSAIIVYIFFPWVNVSNSLVKMSAEFI